ncbi:hypothetical protein [Streptomyces nojiriensis]|uniref:hypothetical protein n=1 Tax=Streptomyces nojiriensis TaxID=66374 RepID=UPI001AD7AB80|nr:hypothetical protein [Streptomyces nojiriensis]QTI44057.1 hypothetical protein JYK04_01820 [Streptomyces nojiriensis]
MAAKKQDEATGADSALTSSPWLWVALVGGAGLVAYKKLSASTAAGSGSGAVAAANDKGFTFEKGA